ncbi:MAG: hypothetical protein P0111_11120 [Nitrospira sp.]|nr:hypothetical protein [Nitrospira sp.]
MNGLPYPHSPAQEPPRLLADERPLRVDGVSLRPTAGRQRKQRVTITLSLELLERLRNAVYWTGHGTLARLITEALDDSVSQMEESNGGAFPQRLAPLKRGRPRIPIRPAGRPAGSAVNDAT